MFKTNFEIIEVYASGVRVTHYLHGTKKDIKKCIEAYKIIGKDYQFVGKEAMIVFH